MSSGLNDWLKNFDSNQNSSNNNNEKQVKVQQKLEEKPLLKQKEVIQKPVNKEASQTTQYSKDFQKKVPKPLTIKTLGSAKTLGQKQQDAKQNLMNNPGLQTQKTPVQHNNQNLKIQLEISAKLEQEQNSLSQDEVRQKKLEEQAKQARLLQQQEYERQKAQIKQKEQEDLEILQREEATKQKKMIQAKKKLKSQDPSLLGQVGIDLDKPQDPRSPELIEKLFIESETNIDFKSKWIEIYEKGLRSTKLNNMTRKLKSGRFRVMSGDKVEILPDMKTHHLTTKELLNKNWLE